MWHWRASYLAAGEENPKGVLFKKGGRVPLIVVHISPVTFIYCISHKICTLSFCFSLLSFYHQFSGIYMICLLIIFRFASLAPEHFYDCLRSCEVNLKDIDPYQTLIKPNKQSMILGRYFCHLWSYYQSQCWQGAITEGWCWVLLLEELPDKNHWWGWFFGNSLWQKSLLRFVFWKSLLLVLWNVLTLTLTQWDMDKITEILTQWDMDKITEIVQPAFSNLTFSVEIICILIKISFRFVQEDSISIKSALFQISMNSTGKMLKKTPSSQLPCMDILFSCPTWDHNYVNGPPSALQHQDV